MNNFRSAAAAIVAAAAVTGLAACGSSYGSGSSSYQQLTPQERALASADAKALAAKCIPTSAAAQIKLAASLKSRPGRVALEDKCGVPPANKAAFEADVLSAVEHGHLTKGASYRKVFFTVTLPKIVEENQG
jgi:hypothetical protein